MVLPGYENSTQVVDVSFTSVGDSKLIDNHLLHLHVPSFIEKEDYSFLALLDLGILSPLSDHDFHLLYHSQDLELLYFS